MNNPVVLAAPPSNLFEEINNILNKSLTLIQISRLSIARKPVPTEPTNDLMKEFDDICAKLKETVPSGAPLDWIQFRLLLARLFRVLHGKLEEQE